MDIRVFPGKLEGTVDAPPSKSAAHRALICAALTSGKSTISGITDSNDMRATVGAMRALGAEILIEGKTAHVTGLFHKKGENGNPSVIIDCIESGSTLRFVLPVAGALGVSCSFAGQGRLPERPVRMLSDQMKAKGIEFYPDGKDSLPFSIRCADGGALGMKAGRYTLPGDISSQYISGLLFALPLLQGDSEIIITGNMASVAYIELTINMLDRFGIKIEPTPHGYAVKGGQHYSPCDIEVEGDYSNAAFWLAAQALGSDLTVTGLNADTTQGDRLVTALLSDMKANSHLTIDGGNIPDIIPILCVCASQLNAETKFINVGRLRIKESDRIEAMRDCLERVGVAVTVTDDSMTVRGGGRRPTGGVEISGYNDHRIVMSMAIAALICREPVIIRGCEAVNKSYPDFFDEFIRLGGYIEK